MNKKNLQQVGISNVKIKDGFWSQMQELVIDTVIPFQEKVLNDEVPGVAKSHALANFRIAAGLEEGEFYGMVFQDSDVAKWLEGVAYSLTVKRDEELESRVDKIIGVIEKAQQPDGYLDTYFIIKEPKYRWRNLLEGHELYCAGHMMEAAVAYYEATGKDKLLKVMERFADHIDNRFGSGKVTGIPGHQEIEIGLMRLYHATGEERYKNLAKYFIDERGKDTEFFIKEKEALEGWTIWNMDPKNTEYNQSHESVYDQKKAVGHSVRAAYMYTAMADIAGANGDEKLFEACKNLWDNITGKRMYVTAGIGSTAHGEAFSTDYDLPNDMAYTETCASIALIFFAKKMLEIDFDGKYADVIERALYNGTISGMQLDGKKFFYVNPLEVEPGVSGEIHGYKHVCTQRPGWYACACCPPNLVRLITSLGNYVWDETEEAIYSHLLIGQETELNKAVVKVESKYPWEGEVSYHISPKTEEEFSLAIHIPSYIKKMTVLLNGKPFDWENHMEKGYCFIKRVWEANDTVELKFDLEVRQVYGNQLIRENAGKVALMRGPFVYCFEGVDHDAVLQALRIPENMEAESYLCEDGVLKGMTLLKIKGICYESKEDLYSEEKPVKKEAVLTAIPYYAWGNRGENQMRVWMIEE